MTIRLFTAALAAASALALAGPADAQEWRGMGRVGGTVVDESGKPISGVAVKATMPAAGNRGPDDSISNDRGEWAVGGLNGGRWNLDFVKDGFETRRLTVAISEVSRARPMEIVLEKVVVVVDPNEVIREKLTEAAALMNAQKFAEARAIYEALAAEHPEVAEFKPLIARAYYGEGDRDKAIALLREASAADPEDVEVRLLLGTLLAEAGQGDEARAILSSVEDANVQDPVVLLNLGIGMINQGKHAEAIPWFTRAIARFPDYPDSYYYRGLAYVATEKKPEAIADLEKFIAIASPEAAELPMAKQILASLK